MLDYSWSTKFMPCSTAFCFINFCSHLFSLACSTSHFPSLLSVAQVSVGCSDMASQSMALDDPVSFRSLMADCHMSSIQIEHIFNAGYTTIALLAHGIHDESKMEEFVEHLSVIPDGETFQTFSPQSAAIRRVIKECIA